MSEQFAFRSLLGLLLASVLAVYAIASFRDNSGPPETIYSKLVWHETPVALPDQSVMGPNGAPVTLADFRGRAVLLNLWASWCLPCIEEMPALSRLQRDLGGPDFVVLAVSLDLQPEQGRDWLDTHKIENLPFHYDQKGRLYDALKAPGLPLSVFIDKEGREVGRIAGAVPWDDPEARALIAKAAGAPPVSADR